MSSPPQSLARRSTVSCGSVEFSTYQRVPLRSLSQAARLQSPSVLWYQHRFRVALLREGAFCRKIRMIHIGGTWSLTTADVAIVDSDNLFLDLAQQRSYRVHHWFVARVGLRANFRLVQQSPKAFFRACLWSGGRSQQSGGAHRTQRSLQRPAQQMGERCKCCTLSTQAR